MNITRADAEHVARLARLALSDGELERLTGELSRIMAYVEKLNEVDTTGVPPTSHTLPGQSAPLRDDVPRPGLTPEQALANAPDQASGSFRVPRVLEG
ncbi:MAG: Asp-tRNA(Asn)/Glu-tRNA(Gln) amidotransferase subunit GatC [Chloroflexota bacterium]